MSVIVCSLVADVIVVHFFVDWAADGYLFFEVILDVDLTILDTPPIHFILRYDNIAINILIFYCRIIHFYIWTWATDFLNRSVALEWSLVDELLLPQIHWLLYEFFALFALVTIHPNQRRFPRRQRWRALDEVLAYLILRIIISHGADVELARGETTSLILQLSYGLLVFFVQDLVELLLCH